ncbi:MAG: hypothetical protein PHE83_02320 [Opitutaceae bacterium]|nr:hypothetical protein [Opitutaceae bacterium]
MTSSLIEALQELRPDTSVHYIHGVLGEYQPGGFRPQRLANLVWVYVAAAWEMAVRRPDFVFVRTSPPGAQLWVALLGALLHIPAGCWMMDYHPEIEARALERMKLGWMAGWLRSIDAVLLQHFSVIVALDHAIANVCRQRAPKVPIIVHPTWGADASETYFPYQRQSGEDRGMRRLVYAGNLGVTHDTRVLGELLKALRSGGEVELVVIGASKSAERTLASLCANAKVVTRTFPRLPFSQLRDAFEQLGVDMGVVLLADESAGLVSPSKFAAYLKYGVPMVYIGPANTNSHEIVTRFGAGFWLRNNSSSEEIQETARAIWQQETLLTAGRRLQDAATYFGGFNGKSLVQELADFLPLPFSSLTRMSDTRDGGEFH